MKYIKSRETTTTEAGEAYKSKSFSNSRDPTSNDSSISTPSSDEEHQENIPISAVDIIDKKRCWAMAKQD